MNLYTTISLQQQWSMLSRFSKKLRNFFEKMKKKSQLKIDADVSEMVA